MVEEADSLSTEARTKEAAHQVFTEKDSDGTTCRAMAAGSSAALTNYYFRSKQKLFRMIFEDAPREFFPEAPDILQRPISLREMISLVVAADGKLFTRNPNLPLFLLAEQHRHPELLASPHKQHPALLYFFNQIREAAAWGEIRALAPTHVLQLIMATGQLLYLSRLFTRQVAGFDQAAYAAFTVRHQQLVADVIMGYLSDF